MKLQSQFNKEKSVDRMIFYLGLEYKSEARISNLSLYHKKLVSIGIEIINDPHLIILDEPTTGLDHNSAINIISLISNFSKSGKAVISTLHQPSSNICNMLDKIMIIASGKCIYFGKYKQAKLHFEGLGYVVPSHTSLIDHILQITSFEYEHNRDADRNEAKRLYTSAENEWKERIGILAKH